MVTPRIVKLFYAAAAVVLLSGAFAICQAQGQTHVMDVLPGTSFLGHDFVAVPFGTLDFGGAVGEQNTGNAAIVTTNGQIQAAPSHGSVARRAAVDDRGRHAPAPPRARRPCHE